MGPDARHAGLVHAPSRSDVFSTGAGPSVRSDGRRVVGVESRSDRSVRSTPSQQPGEANTKTAYRFHGFFPRVPVYRHGSQRHQR